MANETAREHARYCPVKRIHLPEDCPNQPAPTTAQLLGAYSRALYAEKIDHDVISTLVIEAARHLLRDEPLVVRLGVGPFGEVVAK